MKRASLILLFCAAAFAQPAPPPPVKLAPGLPSNRTARIDKLINKYIEENRVAGVVALVLRDGKPVYQTAVGWADKEAGRKMTPNTVFRIASQTKAITSAAVMQLVEEGKIGINQPVGDFIPTFKRTTVLTRDTPAPVPARRAITIADLLTHTSGISYDTDAQVGQIYAAKGLGPSAGNGWYTADKDEPICETMERLGTLPFVSQPGAAYVYGYSIDVLGCVVEKASGVPLDEFFRTRITGRLGLKDPRFYIPPAEKDRLAAVYMTGPDG